MKTKSDEPTTKRRKRITLNEPSIQSPTLDKHANVPKRSDLPYWKADHQSKDGKKQYVQWTNDARAEVDVSAEDFHKLVAVLRTPSCSVSPYKLWWRQLPRFGASDILFQYTNKLPMVVSHLEITLKNNRVASLQKCGKLEKVIHDDCETELSALLDSQQCDHPQDIKGQCKGNFRKPKLDELVIYIGRMSAWPT